MIVAQDQPRCLMTQRLFDYLTRINYRPVDGAFLQDLTVDHPVLDTQADDHESFVRKTRKLHSREIHYRAPRRQYVFALHSLFEISGEQLFDEPNQDGRRASDAAN